MSSVFARSRGRLAGHGGDELHARSAEKRRVFAAERVPNRVR